MEVSFSSEGLQESFTLISKIHTHFLVKKDIFSTKTWGLKDVILDYKQSSEHKDYMIAITKYHDIDECVIQNKINMKSIYGEVYKKEKEGKIFSLYSINENNEVHAYVFLPIYSSLEKKVVAWIVSDKVDKFIPLVLQNNFYVKVAAFMLLLLLFFFIYRALNEQELLNRKIEIEVSKNRLKDQQLIEQSRLVQMGEMISMIAHQWRQPLGAISTTTSNLKLKLELNTFKLDTQKSKDECNKYFEKRLENIEEYVDGLTNTIDDFRNFYKENKKLINGCLEDVIFQALQIIRASLNNDNVELVEEYADKESFEFYDREIMQVILNILKNSQDNFIEKGIESPKIIIKVQNKTILICDNGGGIEEDVLENIFDPYYSTKTKKNGTGLGLYMSKIVVQEHHNGTLTAINKDAGVCFKIDLNIKR